MAIERSAASVTQASRLRVGNVGQASRRRLACHLAAGEPLFPPIPAAHAAGPGGAAGTGG